MKRGLLLINLGTPTAPDRVSVRRYLRDFLADKRVIVLPAFLRYLLLYGVILPFRSKKSAHAYQAIWTPQGSPLLCHSYALANKLQARLGEYMQVVIGMRYGQPSLEHALLQLQACETITLLPLYPQYASATTGSSLEMTLAILAQKTVIPKLNIIRDFYAHPGYIKSQAALIQPHLSQHEYILFSYHGLPEQHLHLHGCKPLCAPDCPAAFASARGCYRAQCQQTTTLLAKFLNLQPQQHGMSFQSRLGKTPWLKPYTDEMLIKLREKGIKHIAVSCPSFVADCLETLEEIGIRGQQQWQSLGGERFTLIPSLNDNDTWVQALMSIVQEEFEVA